MWKKKHWSKMSGCATDQRVVVDSVMSGRINGKDLPPSPKRAVRIYMCSTSDMSWTREEFMLHIYPELRGYCRNNYGIEFQVVDKDFRVPSWTGEEIESIEICQKEIGKCSEYSIGPSFMAVVGKTRNNTILQSKIPEDEFNKICAILTDAGDDVSLLKRWYLLDENSCPHAYILQPVSSTSDAHKEEWLRARQDITTLIKKSVDICIHKGQLSQDRLQKYSVSVTEKELEEFLSTNARDTHQSNCFIIIDESSDLSERVQDVSKTACGFSDAIVTHVLSLQEKEENLQEQLTNGHLKENTKPQLYTRRKTESERLARICFSTLKQMVDANATGLMQKKQDPLFEEVVQHWKFARELAGCFTGREDIIRNIKEYIFGDTNSALVLHGSSGFGLTSIIARCATEVNEWLNQDTMNIKFINILRFCGKTQMSSDIRLLLRSICCQTAHATNKPVHEIPDTYKDLVKHFRNVCEYDEQRGLLILFLDTVDDIDTNNTSYNKLDWLPSTIANNVKIIVSTTADRPGLSKQLLDIVEGDDCHINIGAFNVDLCFSLVKKKLESASRSVTEQQWLLIREIFSHCSSAMFTKLISEEAAHLNSYTPLNGTDSWISVENCINLLLDRLERTNDRILVRRALAYLTASGSGISESELEDILSLDNDVMMRFYPSNDQLQYHHFPVFLWTRIRHELDEYLYQIEAQGVTVLFWWSRHFREVAENRYLNDQDMKKIIHSNMADYYMGTWSGDIKKPYHNKVPEGNGDGVIRCVPHQPMLFKGKRQGNTVSAIYNLRKLIQLPYHLLLSDRLEELLSHVYFNYEWLHAMIKATSFHELLSYLRMSDHVEVKLLTQALHMAESSLIKYPNLLALEISGRLIQHYHEHAHIHKLIDQCDLTSMNQCPVVPNWQLFTVPGGPVMYNCHHNMQTMAKMDVFMIENKDLLLIIAKAESEKRCKVWDALRGETRLDLTLEPGRIKVTPDGKFFIIFKDCSCVRIYKTATGTLHGEVKYGLGKETSVSLTNRYLAFCTENATSPIIIDIKAKRVLHQFRYQAGVVAISQDEKHLVFSTGAALMLHDIPLMRRKCVINTTEDVLKVVFHSSSEDFYTLSKTKQISLHCANSVKKSSSTTSIIRNIEIRTMMLSNRERLLMVSASRELYIIDTASGELKYTINAFPASVFVEPHSVFIGAGFSSCDAHVIAARDMYVGVWDADSGDLLRLLRSPSAPVDHLFISSFSNKIVALSKDETIQVWSLNFLESDIQFLNRIVNGSIIKISPSVSGQKVVCLAKNFCSAQVVDAVLGRCTQSLLHDDRVVFPICDVQISSCGNYVATFVRDSETLDTTSTSSVSNLLNMKIWDLNKERFIYQANNVLFAKFRPDNGGLFFIQCLYASNDLRYNGVMYSFSDSAIHSTKLHEGKILTSPVFSAGWVAYLHQCKEHVNHHENGVHQSNTRLYLIKMTSLELDTKCRRLVDYISTCSENAQFLDVYPFQPGTLLITRAEDRTVRPGGKDCTCAVNTSALIYHIEQDSVVHKFDDFFRTQPVIKRMYTCQEEPLAVDRDGFLHNILSGTRVHIGDGILLAMSRFLLNGRYLATVSQNRRHFRLYRSSDAELKIDCLIHGRATVLEVGDDQRTVFIGCEDGRVMMMTVILELADPVKEVICKLPSRLQRPAKQNLLAMDIFTAERNQTAAKIWEETGKPSLITYGSSSRYYCHSNGVNRSQGCIIQ